MTNNSITANGRANTVKTTFSRETSVGINIQADPAIIWSLLTNASDMARWNSTIVSVTGNIAVGGQIELKSTLDEKRTFKLKVKEFEPEKRLVWGDSQGSRVYTLSSGQGGRTMFTMVEKIGGLFFPLFSRFIPPFDESFEQYAADLKKEAESIQNSKN